MAATASAATPRISAPHLAAFANHTVRILGRVTALRGENAVIDCGGEINVILNRDAHLTLNSYAEVVGRVQSGGDLSVKAFVAEDWGSGIDPKAVDAVVDATHRYKEIFYDPN